jgi:hypothetical protein
MDLSPYNLLVVATVLNVLDIVTTRMALRDPSVDEANGVAVSLASRLGVSIPVAGTVLKVPLEIVLVFLYYLSLRPGSSLALDLLEIVTVLLLVVVLSNLVTVARGKARA